MLGPQLAWEFVILEAPEPLPGGAWLVEADYEGRLLKVTWSLFWPVLFLVSCSMRHGYDVRLSLQALPCLPSSS